LKETATATTAGTAVVLVVIGAATATATDDKVLKARHFTWDVPRAARSRM